MNGILIAVITVAAIGLIAGIILTLASHFMAVEVDETVVKIRECLPGANCGACGYAGCDEYAEKVAGRFAKLTLCIPGGKKAADDMAAVLGVEAGDVKEMRAMVRCCGNHETSKDVMDYQGSKTCSACFSFFRGHKECSYGCMGFGDCVEVCKFDAITIDNGVARVDSELCTGCGACAKVCPGHVIEMVPKNSRTCVACASHNKGAQTRKMCTSGCIGCMKCQKTCKHGAIVVIENLAVVDPSLCVNCGECAEVCPVGCIKIFA